MNSEKIIEHKIYPIGFVKSKVDVKFYAPHQPKFTKQEYNNLDYIELINDQKIIHGLSDLEDFSHIWIIWQFHKNASWKSKVLPPRGDAIKRGVFATRSPHRPNFLGLSAVELIGIEKNRIYIGKHDLINDTPVFDIKPYIKNVDSISEATLGWTQHLYENKNSENTYEFMHSEQFEEQLGFLKEHNIDILTRTTEILALDPFPHRTRRIVKKPDNLYRIGCGPWRIFYSIAGRKITLLNITPGYPISALNKSGYNLIPDREAQIEFYRKWNFTCDEK
jgi:tRNA-Thr(GGU) m(6)t(6)A37 methyltransferase TsaA